MYLLSYIKFQELHDSLNRHLTYLLKIVTIKINDTFNNICLDVDTFNHYLISNWLM
jgi:hypothetical protein